MRFFLPHANTPDAGEKVYSTLLDMHDNASRRVDRAERIFRLRYRHNGKDHEAEVGKPLAPLHNEPVIAILKGIASDDAALYYVCTPTRGVYRDMPVLVGANEIISVDEFDAA